MKALTIKQPWAWAIVAGHKPVENRSWATAYRGPLLIHAGQSRSDVKAERKLAEADDDYETWAEFYGIDLPSDDLLVYSAIIGIVELVDCVPARSIKSPWASDDASDYCWVLENARALSPVQVKGALGVWTLKGKPLADCVRQLSSVSTS